MQHTQPTKTPEAQYAKPNKVSKSPTSTSKGVDQLDSMLGTLQSDMSKQGVNTSPKGHCTACNKPIVGSVSQFIFFSPNLCILDTYDIIKTFCKISQIIKFKNSYSVYLKLIVIVFFASYIQKNK